MNDLAVWVQAEEGACCEGKFNGVATVWPSAGGIRKAVVDKLHAGLDAETGIRTVRPLGWSRTAGQWLVDRTG